MLIKAISTQGTRVPIIGENQYEIQSCKKIKSSE